MTGDLPDWAGRALLAEALRSCGLPWVPSAAWRRRPADSWMTLGDRVAAVKLAARVAAEARRRLPGSVSGAVLHDPAWRAMAWRCTVAAFATRRRGEVPRGW